MGTFQQITIGAVCVGGAFLLGHFLNNQTPPATHPESRQQAPVSGGSSPFAFPEPKEQAAQLPNYRTQSSLGFDDQQIVPLPPPSQLDSNQANPKTDASRDNLADADQELEIEVPDFSSLAAQFKGTLLELPGLNQDPPPPSPVANDAAPKAKNSDGKNRADQNPIAASSQSPFPARNSGESERENPLIPKIQLTVTPPDYEEEDRLRKAPANPLPLEMSTGFQADDFAPRLRGDSVNPSSGSSSSVPPSHPTVGSGVSILETTAANGNSAPPFHPNAVVSYNDAPFSPRTSGSQNENSNLATAMSAAEKTDPEDQNGTWQARNLLANTGDHSSPGAPAESNTGSTVKNLPFGLNEDNRNRLSRLTSSTSSIENLSAVQYENYQTQTGDTLHSISLKYYGTREYYLDIYLANRQRLRNPANVPTGITLRIPIYQ